MLTKMLFTLVMCVMGRTVYKITGIEPSTQEAYYANEISGTHLMDHKDKRTYHKDNFVIVKLLSDSYPNEYGLMTPRGNKNKFILNTIVMGKCKYIILNYNNYKNKLKGRKCMIFENFIKTNDDYHYPRNIIPNMLRALYFLDHYKVIHNNISFESIYKVREGDMWGYRLGNFKYAVEALHPHTDNTTKGIIMYFSPERLTAYIESKTMNISMNELTKHTSKADVYALGIILFSLCYEMHILSDDKPKDKPKKRLDRSDDQVTKDDDNNHNNDDDKKETEEEIKKREEKEHVDLARRLLEQDIVQRVDEVDQMYGCFMYDDKGNEIITVDLLKDMLNKDPAKRISAKEALIKYFNFNEKTDPTKTRKN
eukprot:GHVR01119177.1.p1 GENE.GHVR01119177.1~~GHVR01119177.1.p1  ORF type:complete len:368 (-),score=63.48 GHVR01119177.1:485-1588(-)